MTTLNPAFERPADAGPVVRRIDAGDLRWALAEGWRDFLDRRGDLIFIGFLYPLIGLLTAVLAANGKLLPLLFPLVAGLSILGPAVSAGFYELARRRDSGVDAGWSHFFDPLRDERRAGLVSLASGLVVLFLAWLLAAWLIYQVTMGRLAPTGVGSFMSDLFGTPEGWALIVLGNLAGAVLAVATLALTVVSFPMAVDRPVDPAVAVGASWRSFRANVGPTLGWGARVALILVLGAIPLFIGLAVALPVLGYATWHLYTRLVERA